MENYPCIRLNVWGLESMNEEHLPMFLLDKF